MKKNTAAVASILVALVLLLATTAFKSDLQQSYSKTSPLDSPEKLKQILERDLTAYFSQKFGPKTTVKPELLRRDPPQTKGAGSLFYGWVIVNKPDRSTAEGAVKLTAIEQKRLEVTEFLPRETIMNEPKAIESRFPQPLWNDLRKRAGTKP